MGPVQKEKTEENRFVTATKAFVQLAVDAALLKRGAFAAIAANRAVTGQAFLLVVLTAIVSSLSVLTTDAGSLPAEASARVILSVAGWVIGTSLVLVVATKLIRPSTDKDLDWSMLARAFGFAHAPALLRILGIIPEVTAGVLVLSLAWQLVALIIATKEVAGYRSYLKTIAVLFIAFWPYAVGMYVLNLLF